MLTLLRALLIPILLAVPSLALAGIAFVQAVRNNCNTCTLLDVTINNVQVGSLLTACSLNSTAQTISTVTDTESTTVWAEATNVDSVGYQQYQWWAIAKVAGTHVIRFTPSASTAELVAGVLEHTGAKSIALNKVDGQAQTNPGTGTDAITSTAQTTTEGGELIEGCTAESGGTGVVTAGTGFTCRLSLFNATPCDGTQDALIYDQIQTVPASIAATATTTDTTAVYTTTMGTYLPHKHGGMTMGVGN